MARIAFIGLGVMGAPMARHLIAAGHSLSVYNRGIEKARAFASEHGVHQAVTPAAAAGSVDVVVSCVGADRDLAEITMGRDGVFRNMREGALFIDHTSVSAALASQVAEAAAAQGLLAVDAPVSGGQSGAEKGELSIMCGGSQEAYAAAEPLMQIYAKRIVHFGPAGSGQLAKMVNQIAIAGIVQGVSEALAFAKAAGLDRDLLLEAISSGAAQSWQMDNRWRTMDAGEFDFGFSVDWMRKDLANALDEARRNGTPLPVAALVDQFYAEVQAMGGGRQDTSSLVRRLTR